MARRRKMALVAASIALAAGSLAVAGCGDDDDDSGSGNGENLSGSITIDGSSTVAPLSEAAAELFQGENPDVRVTVGTSGTGGGFEKFCRGETDISDASRPIDEEEIAACESAGISFESISVANDGIAVAVNLENDWAQCLTVEQLNTIWDRGSDINNWNQVDPSFPDERLTLYGPGTDSGTFDFFTEAINGEEGVMRTDYNNIGEDDNAAITGVSGSPGGMAFIPFSFVEENSDKVKAIEVDDGSGCTAPTLDTVLAGEYTPLGRQLFVYPSGEALQRPEVDAFLEFYLDNSEEITSRAGFIPLSDEQLETEKTELDELISGAGGGGETTE